MLGRFDTELHFNGNGALVVGGPVTWAAADRGRKHIRIDARLDQNGEHDHCHMYIDAPKDGQFPQDGVWSMELQTDKITLGQVEAHAFATFEGVVIDQWDQPPEPPLPVTVI